MQVQVLQVVAGCRMIVVAVVVRMEIERRRAGESSD
jgi:hypothetical protein